MSGPERIWREMGRLHTLLDEALVEVRKRAVEAAQLESEAKKQQAIAYLKAEGTVKERESVATRDTADLAERARIAAALEKAATEALRNYRQQLSALQTLAGAQREEAAFARTGPRLEP